MLHGFDDDGRSVVAEGAETGRLLLVLGLEVGHELLGFGGRDVGGEVVREVRAFEGVATDFHEIGSVPAVAAEQRDFDAEALRSAGDGADLRIIPG